ncbi:nicotinate phosphoribosyltransferase [Thorsellia anophelis]|uniref:Nicotinamide phosphoribosyltransferase n=1 Tax=Thorsellia anophelis DSM 18579 TaxID=1123402 RepID=A0A1I0F9X8_9GAMM|nr:nicotinate phosphoribosyltransferase [Thorsellia anophelis]SET54625.1 nicotinamide phosphoribosyltransferase [Thorsellia anophelis DSM 18579]
MKLTALNAIDWYKVSHKEQYPKGTTMVFSNFTPRTDKYMPKSSIWDGKVVVFGLQGFIKWYFIDLWNETFFNRPKSEVIDAYRHRVENALGKDAITYDHIEALHDLGYLPIEIRTLPEGTRSEIQIPIYTIHNTHPDFFWLTNYLESVMSAESWKSITSATSAYQYRQVCELFAQKTCDNADHINFQCHDFSFRGMSGLYDTAQSGAGHLLSFLGTDSVLAIDYLDIYYAGNQSPVIGVSIPASEHSTATTNIAVIIEKLLNYPTIIAQNLSDDELRGLAEEEFFHDYITKIYPSGFCSYVADSYDYWRMISEIALKYKKDILAREGKVVFRPDSGDPMLVICGDENAPTEIERKGSIEVLWEIFGGTVNEKGYKVLDPHVGLIYGDSITLQRAEAILAGLEKKGFASSNIVFGVGSHTYQYVTRDSLGFAVKATAAIVNDKEIMVFKAPKTDSAKRSAKGFLKVIETQLGFKLVDQIAFEEIEIDNALKTVFKNGQVILSYTLEDIRCRLLNN